MHKRPTLIPIAGTSKAQKLWKNLQFDNTPIVIYRPLVDVLHSVKAAVLLSQMIYWTRTGVDVEQNDGWFHKTSRQFTLETGLSKWEQETARKKLKDLGVVEVKMQGLPGAAMPAMPWYRVNLECLSLILVQAIKVSVVSCDSKLLTLNDLRGNGTQLRSYLSTPIPYHTVLAKVAGGVNEGLMLSFLIRNYFKGYSQKVKGFITRSIEQWKTETGSSYEEQRNARRALLSQDLIEERHLRASRDIFTAINMDVVFDKLSNLGQKINEKTSQSSDEKRALLYAEKGVSSYGESRNTGTAKVEIKVQQNPKYSYGESQNKGTAEVEIVNKEQITLNQEYVFTDYLPKPQPQEASLPCPVELVDEKTVVVVNDESKNQWIWPKCFVDEQDKRIAAQKSQVMAKSEIGQTLLDEMMGNERAGTSINKPLRYLDRMIALVQSGTFIAEVAHKVKAGRELRAIQATQVFVKRQEIVDYEKRIEEKRLRRIEEKRLKQA